MTKAEGITFEADGTANHISINHLSETGGIAINHSPEFVAGRPDAVSGLVFDVDGSLTAHGGGGPGYVLTPKLDYYRDSNDLAPSGWNAYISNDRFAQFKIGINHEDDLSVQHVGGNQGEYIPEFRIQNGNGGEFLANRWNLTYVQRMYAKLNAGDYTIEFAHQLPQYGFDVMLQTRLAGQVGDSTVFRFVDVGLKFKPDLGVEVSTLNQVRSATENAFFRDLEGDLWLQVFAEGNNGPTTVTIPINPTAPIVVSNTNDAGTGSLREAITMANANPGLDVITFGIGNEGTTQTISLQSALPTITDRLVLDGASQSLNIVPDGGFEHPDIPNNSFKQANGMGLAVWRILFGRLRAELESRITSARFKPEKFLLL